MRTLKPRCSSILPAPVLESVYDGTALTLGGSEVAYLYSPRLVLGRAQVEGEMSGAMQDVRKSSAARMFKLIASKM